MTSHAFIQVRVRMCVCAGLRLCTEYFQCTITPIMNNKVGTI